MRRIHLFVALLAGLICCPNAVQGAPQSFKPGSLRPMIGMTWHSANHTFSDNQYQVQLTVTGVSSDHVQMAWKMTGPKRTWTGVTTVSWNGINNGGGLAHLSGSGARTIPPSLSFLWFPRRLFGVLKSQGSVEMYLESAGGSVTATVGSSHLLDLRLNGRLKVVKVVDVSCDNGTTFSVLDDPAAPVILQAYEVVGRSGYVMYMKSVALPAPPAPPHKGRKSR